VPKAATIAAATLLATIAVLASIPTSSGDSTIRTVPGDRQSAIAACLGFNDYAPARAVEAAPDGMGDWTVWVRDKDEDLWMCNASAGGDVYANVLIQGDLLAGAGEETIALVPASVRTDASDPAGKAERLCAAVGDLIEDVSVVATVADGVGDYVVWLKGGNESYWMCNASADFKLYVFEPVQYPLDGGVTSPAASNRVA